MLAVLDHFKIAKADLVVGQSTGGFVAAATAARHPSRVGAVVMVDGGIPITPWLPSFFPVGHIPSVAELCTRLRGEYVDAAAELARRAKVGATG